MSATCAAARTSMPVPCSTTSSHTKLETSSRLHYIFFAIDFFLFSKCRVIPNHAGESFFDRCDFCNKPYTNYMSLRNHMRIHGQKRYMCDLCGKAFRLARYLRNHQRIHDDGPNRFDCPSCCKSYRTMLELAQHRCTAASSQVCKKVCSRTLPSLMCMRMYFFGLCFNGKLRDFQ